MPSGLTRDFTIASTILMIVFTLRFVLLHFGTEVSSFLEISVVVIPVMAILYLYRVKKGSKYSKFNNMLIVFSTISVIMSCFIIPQIIGYFMYIHNDPFYAPYITEALAYMYRWIFIAAILYIITLILAVAVHRQKHTNDT